MSFQDVKPSSAPRKPGEKRGLLQSYQGPPPPSPILEEQDSATGMGYSALSDDILAYRRHVDMLQKLAALAGTPQETAATQMQLRLQTDVVSELGAKIESKLLASERSLAAPGGGVGRASTAAQARATHAKLTRDYRRVETVFKNIQMDVKRRKGLAEARRKEALEEEERKKFSGDAQEEVRRMQVQMQEDRLAEEIIREREAEIRNINKGMHTVNEIYKDLAHIVGDQQDDIDAVEDHMENTNKNAQAGLNQIQKANDKADTACIIC
jgi:t-SNARE complex subunit (syntaxin)